MKYRKKPVIVEAYQTDKEMIIHTLEGDMKASVGDFIITGVNGEQYPCKPDIFEKTYEKIDTVSRKAEIDAIKRYIRGFDAIDVNFLDGLKTAIQIIEQLPHEYSNAQNTLQRVGSVECEDIQWN